MSLLRLHLTTTYCAPGSQNREQSGIYLLAASQCKIYMFTLVELYMSNFCVQETVVGTDGFQLAFHLPFYLGIGDKEPP